MQPSIAFSACPDGKLYPLADETGWSSTGRARETPSLISAPSSVPTSIVIAAHRAAVRASRRHSQIAASSTANRKTKGCST